MTIKVDGEEGAKRMEIVIEPMRKEEAPEVSAMAARAFAPTPMPMAAMGGNSEKVQRTMEKGMKALFTRMPGQFFVARSNGKAVGAMRIVVSPGCQPSMGLRLMMPLMMYATMGMTARKVLHFRGRWAKRDPAERHYHLDPLVVEPEVQGKGIGSQLLTHYCQVVDEEGIAAYHETDSEANVRLYKRFGFEVKDTEEILGVTNYFMYRKVRD
jgi:ribosomal protein S18 acetylase RimI-like enzyme